MKIFFILLISLLLVPSCQKIQKLQTNVTQIDSTNLQNLIDESRNSVLVINVWATWCVPCVEEMPDLIKLAKYYENENVNLIGISIDYPEEIETKILPFLQQHKINFPVYVNNFNNDEVLINFLNSNWSGAIPATFVYDKKGIQKDFLLGKHSFIDFKTAVEKHL